MEILFWRHQSKSQKLLKTCTIYCRVTINGQRAEIGSTHIEVPYDDFDTSRQEVFSSNPEFVFHNIRLQDEFRSRILTIYTELLTNKQTITSDAIKRMFLKVEKTNARLMEATDLYIEDFREKTIPQKNLRGVEKKARRSVSTLGPMNSFRKKLFKFLESRREQHITIEELTNNWFVAWENWMFELGHEHCTVEKHLKRLKHMTAWAFLKKKLCTFDPLVGCEVESSKSKDPNYLSEIQFQRWIKHKFATVLLQEVADLFAVYCRTGMHYMDLKVFIKNPSEFLKVGLDGTTWIYKPREKTEIMAKVPGVLLDDIMHIVKKYGGWNKLPMMYNNNMNEWLKLCATDINLHLPDELKVFEGLSVKHGRCTLTDYWLNELGNSVDDLLPILGRTSSRGLERYGRKDERAVIKALNR